MTRRPGRRVGVIQRGGRGQHPALRDDIQRFVERFNAGANDKALCAEFGIAGATIYSRTRIARRMGFTLIPRRRYAGLALALLTITACATPPPDQYVTRPWACSGWLRPGSENALLFCGVDRTLGWIVPRSVVESEGR